MSITRRELLRNVGGLAAWVSFPMGCNDAAQSGATSSELSVRTTAEIAFLHGVASGDPYLTAAQSRRRREG